MKLLQVAVKLQRPEMRANRERYVQRLIDAQGNGLIKIITGIRRCGKSYLLFNLFYDRLIQSGIPADDIVCIHLEEEPDEDLMDRNALNKYVRQRTAGKEKCYVLIDEVQEVEGFSKVLNGFLNLGNLEIYVTGSNSRYLSSDIETAFKGRGYSIHLYPLSFSEFMECYDGTMEQGLDYYMNYGGLPGLLNFNSDVEKRKYLQHLMNVVYKTDIKEHNGIKMDDELTSVMNVLCSSTGSLTNPTRITNTINSELHRNISAQTVDRYIGFMTDAFMFEKVQRYDLKGRSCIGALYKFYPMDVGLRNAQLNFRQTEKPHLMESIIYLELRSRCYEVNVGMVESRETRDGKQVYKQLEIDFVINDADKRYYVQSAYSISDREKKDQEKRPFRKLNDGFKRVLITADPLFPYHDDDGVLIINIIDFLKDRNSLDL